MTVPEAARQLGTTVPNLKKIAVAEKLEFVNFRSNGKLYVSEDALNAYRSRCGKPPVTLRLS